MDLAIRLLGDLVRIPSVNPMGRPLAGPGYLEAEVTAYLESFLRGLGVQVERQEIAPGRANLLARYQAPKSSKTVLFDAHQDTVPADGMTIEPFGAAVEGGRMYGRGACDVKGGMAAMLAAFERLVRERPAKSASVILALTVDEEYTHKGSSRLAQTAHGADLAIVAEPTRLSVVNAHKGAVRWRIRAGGTACHSSTPQLGDNAIYRMARVIAALELHARELAESGPDPILGPPSLSVGRIEGGTSVNVVPDWCKIEIDRRLIPGEDADSVRARVESCLREQLGGLDRIEASEPWVRMPPLRPRPLHEDPYIEAIRAAIRSVKGTEPAVIGVPYGTDAGPLAESGVLPCYVIGPGDIAQAHTKDEWIELAEVEAAAEAYHAICLAVG